MRGECAHDGDGAHPTVVGAPASPEAAISTECTVHAAGRTSSARAARRRTRGVEATPWSRCTPSCRRRCQCGARVCAASPVLSAAMASSMGYFIESLHALPSSVPVRGEGVPRVARSARGLVQRSITLYRIALSYLQAWRLPSGYFIRVDISARYIIRRLVTVVRTVRRQKRQRGDPARGRPAPLRGPGRRHRPGARLADAARQARGTALPNGNCGTRAAPSGLRPQPRSSRPSRGAVYDPSLASIAVLCLSSRALTSRRQGVGDQ